MALRAKLEAKPETLLDLARASRSRYFEGLDLILVGRPWAGNYLTGYTAEMILKNAYFLCTGALFSDPVKPELGPTTMAAAGLGVTRNPEGFHSIPFWTEMVIAKKDSVGRPLSDDLRKDLRDVADHLYAHWWVPMRYRRAEPDPTEVKTFVESVSWLMSKRSQLWRQ